MTEVTSIEQRIEDKIDKGTTSSLTVSRSTGALAFTNANEVMEFAKMMSVAGEAVPKHCRGRPGVCLAIAVQALEWQMSAFAVANKSYVVNDRVAYESQLVHAVIEQRAPIVGRIRHSYSGEGDKRRCKVWAFVRGENDPLPYESPEIGQIQPKNSPLWKTKPDLQLYYNATRDFCRMYFPDVLLSIYAKDELEDSEQSRFDQARNVSPSQGLMERLQKTGEPTEGFAVNHQVEPDDQPEGKVGFAKVMDDVLDEQIARDEQHHAVLEPDAPASPTDENGYLAYAKDWIATAATEAQIDDRWKREKRLRLECKVSGETIATLVDLKEDRIAKLRKDAQST